MTIDDRISWKAHIKHVLEQRSLHILYCSLVLPYLSFCVEVLGNVCKYVYLFNIFPTKKHRGGGVMVWGCFFDDTIGNLFKIQGILNHHGWRDNLQQHSIPSDLHLVGPSFVFQQDNDPKYTSRLCKGYLTKKESDGVRTRWPGPHNHPIQLKCFGMSWTAEWIKGSQQVLSTSGNSSKTVGKPFQGTTSWIWEWAKLSSKQQAATLQNLRY